MDLIRWFLRFRMESHGGHRPIPSNIETYFPSCPPLHGQLSTDDDDRLDPWNQIQEPWTIGNEIRASECDGPDDVWGSISPNYWPKCISLNLDQWWCRNARESFNISGLYQFQSQIAVMMSNRILYPSCWNSIDAEIDSFSLVSH